MKKTFLILSFIILFSSSRSFAQIRSSVWTRAYEQKWYEQIDSEIKPGLPDNAKREALTLYIIKRLKEELPGGIESVPVDSVNRLSMRIGKEYAYKHSNDFDTGLLPSLRPWTKDLENLLREVLLKDVSKENYKEQENLCNCTLSELKRIYPDSVMIPFPKDIIQKIAKDCINKVSKQLTPGKRLHKPD